MRNHIIRVHDHIELCKHVFRVAPLLMNLGEDNIRFKCLGTTFTTTSKDADDEILYKYALNYDFFICQLFVNLCLIM